MMDEPVYVFQTERLKLREITVADAESLLLLFEDPIAMQYFPSLRNRAETMEWIQIVQNRYETDGHGIYACILKDTDVFIGYCGLLLQRELDGSDEIEVGYGLIRDYWGKGYAAEAARGCMEHAFRTLGAPRVISLIRPENVPSIKVARRNKMRFAKTIFRFGYVHQVYTAVNPYLKLPA